jgi:hypothetical protein
MLQFTQTKSFFIKRKIIYVYLNISNAFYQMETHPRHHSWASRRGGARKPEWTPGWLLASLGRCAIPTNSQLPFFILLNIAEGLTFGLGISFLFLGYPMVRAISPASTRLTHAAHLSISWLLFNWWPHDSLHIHNGMNLGGLLGIEYAFHVTLMIAGVILAYFFPTLLRQPS